MKKKLDIVTKAKLIYSGELALFAIAFLVLAILEFTQVIKISTRHHLIFNWVTLAGGTWLIADFLWALLSKKRRKRVALLDKIIHLPLGIYLISFDLFCLISQTQEQAVFQYGIPCALSYLFVCYTFEAIYHFFVPVPGLLDIKEEDNNNNVIEGDATVVEPAIDNNTPQEEEEKEEDQDYEKREE